MPNVEIIPRYREAVAASDLLYTPVSNEVTCRESRCYQFDSSGEESALHEFVEKTLGDPYSLDLHWQDSPVIEGYRFILDIGMKPRTLDLEREYILNYQRGAENPGFELAALQIYRRIYVFGPDTVPAERFIKDLVNPVVHIWQVTKA